MLPDFLSDIPIKIAAVPSHLEGAVARGVLWQASPDRFLLDVPDVARYLVEDGNLITIEPMPQADKEEVNRFLRMTPFAALLFQRDITTFHAAAVVGTQGAVLLAGDSGSGKSMLLAALLKRGWRMLSDDLAVVDLNENDMPMVIPTFPELALWSDVMEKLEIKNSGKGRHVILMEKQFTTAPQVLKAIYCLSVHNDNEIEVRNVEGADRFSALSMFLYNSHIANALLDRVAYMRRASVIAQKIPLHRLRRPRGRWSADELADMVEKECQ